jgi:hypothetical protein
MANLNPVKKSQLRTCNKCKAQITFVQNRNGKYFAVDVFCFQGGLVYKSNMGAYGNLTPWHKCHTITEAMEAATPRPARTPRQQEFIDKYLVLAKTRATNPNYGEALDALCEEFKDLEEGRNEK